MQIRTYMPPITMKSATGDVQTQMQVQIMLLSNG